jgi:hypothetical protein
MNTAIPLICAAAAVALSGCYRTATSKANYQLRYDDRPARVTCLAYGNVMVDTVSNGAVERDDDGLVSFVDSRTGRMIKTEGECLIEHLAPVQQAHPAWTRNLPNPKGTPE